MNSFRIETKEEFFKILVCDEDTVTSAFKSMKHNTLRLNFELFQFSFEFFYFDFHPLYICYIVLKKSDILPICFVLYIDGSCF